ncbi:hypothetical protein EON65_15605 [archaeon]|nr:MAG: hypothetical protein EON65_15605 [archaeon]
MMLGLRNRIGHYGGRWRLTRRWESSQLQRDPDWSKYRNLINVTFEQMVEDKDYLAKLKTSYIDIFSWKTFLNVYRRKLIKQPTAVLSHTDRVQLQTMMGKVDLGKVELLEDLADVERKVLKNFLFQHAYDAALHDLENVIVTNKTVCGASDLTMPHQWFPHARLMKRKIIYHGGPTNSGKTYHAIQRLKAADPTGGGGLYCGPLRLLALEIYETLNRSGVCTDLMTGQERKELPGSTHVSSTVEMVNINRQYDVAVIDEIQMIADRDRAHSW